MVGTPACGDVMRLQILVDEKGKMVDAMLKTFVCGSAAAPAGFLPPDRVKGKAVEEALAIEDADSAKALCPPSPREPALFHAAWRVARGLPGCLQTQTRTQGKSCGTEMSPWRRLPLGAPRHPGVRSSARCHVCTLAVHIVAPVQVKHIVQLF